jgi:predicted transcriptional regulator
MALRLSSDKGHKEVVRYLHTAFHLTTEDARARGNWALRFSAQGGHLDVVRYLHTEFKLTKDDVARAIDEYTLTIIGTRRILSGVLQYLESI